MLFGSTVPAPRVPVDMPAVRNSIVSIAADRTTSMSYESVREHLARCRQAARAGDDDTEGLIEALEQLTIALEADLTQIKGALGHMAHLLEERQV